MFKCHPRRVDWAWNNENFELGNGHSLLVLYSSLRFLVLWPIKVWTQTGSEGNLGSSQVTRREDREVFSYLLFLPISSCWVALGKMAAITSIIRVHSFVYLANMYRMPTMFLYSAWSRNDINICWMKYNHLRVKKLSINNWQTLNSSVVRKWFLFMWLKCGRDSHNTHQIFHFIHLHF